MVSWGPAGVFLLAALDSGGIPIPVGVDVLVLTVSLESFATGSLAAALAVLGSTLGCLFLFQLGRKGGEAYLDRKLRGPRRAAQFRRWYGRYGLLTVFVPVLVPAPLPTKIFVLLAGALNARRWPFLVTVIGGRSLRYFGLAWLGGSLSSSPSDFLREHGWLMVAVAAGLFAALALVVKCFERRATAAKIAGADVSDNPS